MDGKANKQLKDRKKPGRKPMTPEEKAAAAKARAAEKERADNLKPEVLIQFQGAQTNLDALVEAAKENFHATKKRTLITSLQLYVKPEERMAYYVVNQQFNGSIAF